MLVLMPPNLYNLQQQPTKINIENNHHNMEIVDFRLSGQRQHTILLNQTILAFRQIINFT